MSSTIAFLRRTQSSAQALASKLAAHVPTYAVSTHVVSSPVLTLPGSTGSLGPQLVQLGVDSRAATRVAAAVLRACQDLKSSFEEDFRRRGHIFQTAAPYFNDPKSASLIPAAYAAIYAKTINDWISYIVNDFTPRLLRTISSRTRATSEPYSEGSSPRRRPFNSNAIPTLEHFFGQNAFPSRLEKHELASKCDMEFRQIHVWFQNRRSRFRKEGKELKQPDRQGTLSEELENTIVDTLLPRSPTDEEDVELVDGQGIPETFDFTNHSLASNPLHITESPAHAFPSPYPPLCSYNPFPIDSSAPVFSLPWLRIMRSPATPPATSIDVADLTALLAKMCLSEDEPVRHPDAMASKIFHCCSIGFITPCSRAPHPALIRKPRRTVRSPCHATRSESRCDRPESRRRTSACGRLSPVLNLQTNSDDHSASPQPLRPKRSLPQRYPKHPPKYNLDQVSRPSGHSLSRSYSSRSTGSSSDVDSPLATPPLLPMTLPIEIVYPSSDGNLFPTCLLTSLLSTHGNTLHADQARKRHMDEFLDFSAFITSS